MEKNSGIDKIVNDDQKEPIKLSTKKKVLLVLTVVFLVYCTYLLFVLLNNPTETFIVEQGKIYKEETVTGYIIRDEQVVENEATNRKNCTNEIRRKKSC